MPNEPGLAGDSAARSSQRAVFLSYASEDADAAQRICAVLRDDPRFAAMLRKLQLPE